MSQRGEVEAFFGIWYANRLSANPKGRVMVQDFSLPAYIHKEGDDKDDIVPSYLVNIRITESQRKSRFYAGRSGEIAKEVTDLALQLYLHRGILVYPKVETDD